MRNAYPYKQTRHPRHSCMFVLCSPEYRRSISSTNAPSWLEPMLYLYEYCISPRDLKVNIGNLMDTSRYSYGEKSGHIVTVYMAVSDLGLVRETKRRNYRIVCLQIFFCRWGQTIRTRSKWLLISPIATLPTAPVVCTSRDIYLGMDIYLGILPPRLLASRLGFFIATQV